MTELTQLHIDNVICTRNDTQLFQPVEFTLRPSQMVHVQGPNGIGKTTLLRCVAGFIRPASGQILWSNIPISQHEDYSSNLGFLGHKAAIKSSLTVYENLHWSPSINVPPMRDQIEETLERLELSSLSHRLAGTLSSGQKQRLALSKLFLSKARLWIMDEPFNSLDTQGVALVLGLLDWHLSNLGMVIVTSHLSVLEGCQVIELLDTPSFQPSPASGRGGKKGERVGEDVF
jgi:heme exporter protein A